MNNYSEIPVLTVNGITIYKVNLIVPSSVSPSVK